MPRNGGGVITGALSAAGMARWRCAAFLAIGFLGSLWAQEAPVVRALQAWADVDGTLRVRWITGPLTRGSVHCGPTTDLGTVHAEDPDALRGTTNNRDSGTGWANNQIGRASCRERV